MEDKQKTRKERAKAAVAHAKNWRWQKAAAIKNMILADFPDDQEAINRLGKSLSELGRNREAKEAFEWALALSPHNTIARKNLERLNRLGDDQPSGERQASSLSHTLIAESGKVGVTSLLGLAPAKVLFTLAPGHVLSLRIEGNNLKAYSAQGQLIGQVEPKLASRLARLANGGNKYEATVTSVEEGKVIVILREVYKDPSLQGTVSFPSRGAGDARMYVPANLLSADNMDDDTQVREPVAVKDWSDDDTEPGDDDAFSPVAPRIINEADRESSEAENAVEDF